MLDFHRQPQPDICDVCLYVEEHELDCAYEHARARLATTFLLEDLAALPRQETTRLSALAVRSSGFAPGPVHPIDPRHWFWAMYHEPEIRISLGARP
jgi:hypothetical protein